MSFIHDFFEEIDAAWTSDSKISLSIIGSGYGELASDHDLATQQPRFNSDKLPTAPPELTGDAELAKAAASWIATGFTGHGASAGTLASGSAPGEVASDPTSRS
ncbi:MAG TPA: hypothetical protein VH143_35700 [Kofleriaceae bacterium]|jgi:hypothetical protein|nr:hypothetical protein [Kofleriaceae bacterium]